MNNEQSELICSCGQSLLYSGWTEQDGQRYYFHLSNQDYFLTPLSSTLRGRCKHCGEFHEIKNPEKFIGTLDKYGG